MFEMRPDRRAVLAGGLGTLAMLRAPAFAQNPPPSERIERLIASMTPEEKAGQLTILPAAQASEAALAANPAAAKGAEQEQTLRVRRGTLGAVFNSGSADWHRRMQRVAVEESRLRIPMLFGADVIHGFRTIFPVPLAEAASFDPELCERTARAAAEEATSAGLHWNFAPMVDIARDARWGRGVEGAGEDVELGRRLAAARVRGFQGRRGLGDRQSMLATPKHLAAYGAAQAGLDYNTVDISERTLRETYFPPFQAGFEAGAMATMASFNEINGVPSHGNPWLLKDVLRGEWGFEGFVVSDYTGDQELIAHGFAKDERDATRIAIMAGVDMSMASDLYVKHLPDLMRTGEVPAAVVDASLRRVLLLKERLGLFDDPYRRHQPRNAERDDRPKNRPLARESARRSVVMLKNDGVLPLRKRGQRIALIGPFANGPDHLNGPWVLFGKPEYCVSIADGMRRAMASAGDLAVVPGCGVDAAVPGGVEAAVAAARAADVAVLVLGEAERMSGEAQSRAEITIPAAQRALAEAVAATGKPIVVLLKNGRALVLEGAVANARAVLVTWFLGAETGTGIADLLFGDHSPSGRLPISFPRAAGQSPYHYDHKRSGRPTVTNQPGEEYKTRFREFTNTAAYPFGHGLTYGDVAYEGLTVGGGRLAWGGELRVEATVRNRGARAADELVQLYVHDRAAGVTRPVRELKDWARVTLGPGESRRVGFTLRRDDLRFVGLDMKRLAEPGMFDVWIAPNAEAGLKGEFELLRA